MARRRTLSVAWVAVLTLVVSCGDDDDSGSAGSAVPSASAVAGSAAPATTAFVPPPIPWPGTAPNLTPVDAATAADWLAQAQAALAAQQGLNGMWIAISDPAKGYWTAAVGNAIVEPATPATIADHARIGSATKTFTATAILQQVAAGALSLDDTVATVVPDVATQFPATAEITVRQLLNMSSGLPDYGNAPGTVVRDTIADPTKVWTPQELIANALQSPAAPVGTSAYSTTNYIILGLMLEKLTGQPVDQVLTGVATAAGLTATALQPPDQVAMPAPASHGYFDAAILEDPAVQGSNAVAGTDVTDWTMSWGGAGGGMYSTVEELFRWAATGYGTSLLPPELAAERLKTDSAAVPLTNGYGLGIIQLATPGWVSHDGQTLGWESFSAYNPATGATIAGLVNAPNGNAAVQTLATSILGLAG